MSTPPIISACLGMTPIAGLKASFQILSFIWRSIQNVQAVREQLTTLSTVIAHLLQTLNGEYHVDPLLELNTDDDLELLEK